MPKSIYWCPHCEIPVIENSICSICGSKGTIISQSGICNPVFLQERKLLSVILEKDVNQSNVWYLGSSFYLIDGKRLRVPYVDFYKQRKHLAIGEALRNDIINNDTIQNQELFISANERYLNEIIYEAEEYVINLIKEVESEKDKNFLMGKVNKVKGENNGTE